MPAAALTSTPPTSARQAPATYAVPANAPLAIVINAGSGQHDREDKLRTLRGLLAQAGRPHELLVAHGPRQLPGLIERAVDLARSRDGVVVACGGDGTLNAVAQAALAAGLPFGALPQGTFNYFGRAQGLQQDLAAATRALLAALASGQARPVQVGLINDRIFLVNASLGLYPRLLEDREAFKRQYGRSRWVAKLAALFTLLRAPREMTLRIGHEGDARVLRTTTLFVGNNALQLEQVGLPEAQDVEEGRLAVLTLQPMSRAALLGLALRGAIGRLGEAQRVDSFACAQLTVEPLARRLRQRIKVAMDGESVWLRPPLVFRVAPQPLRLVAPPAEPTA